MEREARVRASPIRSARSMSITSTPDQTEAATQTFHRAAADVNSGVARATSAYADMSDKAAKASSELSALGKDATRAYAAAGTHPTIRGGDRLSRAVTTGSAPKNCAGEGRCGRRRSAATSLWQSCHAASPATSLQTLSILMEWC